MRVSANKVLDVLETQKAKGKDSFLHLHQISSILNKCFVSHTTHIITFHKMLSATQVAPKDKNPRGTYNERINEQKKKTWVLRQFEKKPKDISESTFC